MTGIRRLARSTWSVPAYVAIVGASIPVALEAGVPATQLLINVTVYLAFTTMGAWISYRSANRIGAVFQSLGLTAAVLFASQSYIEYAPMGDPTRIAGGMFAAWVNHVAFAPFFALNFVFPLLLFPTGRPPSGRWRVVSIAAWIWFGVTIVASAIAPELELSERTVPNPLALRALSSLSEPVVGQIFPLTMLFAVVAVASLIFRYRASGAEQRAQIKWFLYAGAFLTTALIADEIVLDLWPVASPTIEIAIETAALLLGLLGLPVATAIAILKYRLYDIDVVINRTLVYGLLTAILAGVYLAGVSALQLLARPLTEGSDLAVAGSTLAVAALFRPLRRRIQDFIDHYFYRRKYDAAKTVEEFSSRLRQEVNLQELTNELVAVVRRTMQPAHVTLWLRSPEATP